MWRTPGIRRILGIQLLVAICSLQLAGTASAAVPSALSKWLSKEAMPELLDRLQHHPRYENQRVEIVNSANNALSEAMAKLLVMNLQSKPGIQLRVAEPNTAALAGAATSVDSLSCTTAADVDYLLEVSAVPSTHNKGQVRIQLKAAGPAAAVSHSWLWNGKLNAAEREYSARAAATPARNGSLAQPWTETDIELAAYSLAREFACSLRPQLQTRIAMDWPDTDELPAVFADTVNTSRHLLGSYRELGIADGQADYVVNIELKPFRQNTWQLWLVGTALNEQLAPIQAVTYFTLEDLHWPSTVPATAQLSTLSLPAGEPEDFIVVEMLGVSQRDSGRRNAELEVTLRISNRADWPLEYSFTLSGGHFNYCIAEPGYYRHDRYGNVAGSIKGGATELRRLVIARAQHRPTPLVGMRKCAGFRDLDGFEDFASHGYKVTDYLRWQNTEVASR
ncbi:MAG: hypothetical protein ABJ308_01220 [Halieaceae bacterium]